MRSKQLATTFALLSLALGASACVSDRSAAARIVDPQMPGPILCFGPRRPCGVPAASNHRSGELRVVARPADAADGPERVVWEVELGGADRRRVYHIRYGVAPEGWRESVDAEALEPGYVYELENLAFIVDGDRIRRVSR